ncbi:diguanylate cyclase [Vibrio sp. CAIM 722]|uniref:diguanylate cyclase n=1 Tax=Vibrio eleionomae TaxID=2653505 RepID=A0A7X4LJA2_9VIBR|nr:diguanylate cyclase [Vibrio eleionomae]
MNIFYISNIANIINVIGSSVIACFFLSQVSHNLSGIHKQAANRFVAAFLLLGLAYFSYSLRQWGFISLSVFFNNAFYMLAAYLFLIGIAIWYQYSVRICHYLLIFSHALIFATLQLWLVNHEPSSTLLRIHFCSGSLALIFFSAFFLGLKKRKINRSGELLLCISMLICGWAVLGPTLILVFSHNLQIYMLSVVGLQILASDFLLGALMSLFLFDQINWHYKRSMHDELTGLYNRRYFREKLPSYIDETGLDGVIAMFDIDHFKHVNDSYGHDMGDQVMKKVADVLCQYVPLNGMIARYGGEEFIWYAPWPTLTIAYDQLDVLREAISHLEFQSGTETFKISVSVGCARLLAQSDPLEAIKCADNALYKAKISGRNQVITTKSISAQGLQHRPA